MYSIFYYKGESKRHIVAQDIHTLRDVARMLTSTKIYFKVHQDEFPISCMCVGVQDLGYWLRPDQDYYRILEEQHNDI